MHGNWEQLGKTFSAGHVSRVYLIRAKPQAPCRFVGSKTSLPQTSPHLCVRHAYNFKAPSAFPRTWRTIRLVLGYQEHWRRPLLAHRGLSWRCTCPYLRTSDHFTPFRRCRLNPRLYKEWYISPVDSPIPHPRPTRLPAMSLRSTRTLSRLFQATMRVTPEKRYSGTFEDVVPTLFESGFMFEPDLSSKEHERIWDYYTKLVFKDGEFLVCTTLVSYSGQGSHLTQDMELLDPKRRLLCAGKLFRRSDSAFERKGQIELLVLLFDNYR